MKIPLSGRTMEDKGNFRIATPKDVYQITEVHKRAYQGFFLTFLGRRFLSNFYYTCLTDPSGIGFVYEENDSICGFVIGSSQPAGFYSRLLRKYWWRFALASLIPILKNPLIIPRLLRAFQKPQDEINKPETATLMSIAVLPDAQGQGVGQKLINAFLQEASTRGMKYVDLTTDSNNNERVNRFYLDNGFQVTRSFVTPEGRKMNEYTIQL